MNRNDDFSNNSIMKNFIKDIILIILGSLIMAFAVSQFLLPNQLSTGGFSGIATILYYYLNIPMGTTVFILNLPLFIVACFVLGRKFLIKAITGTACLSIFLNILEQFPSLTSDKFLACIYGGVLIGLGTGLILKASASTGGSDLIASITRRINPRISTSNMIMILDVVIVLLNVLFFKTVEVGLYSAIAIFLMGKIIDLIFEGINFSKVMFIVSDKHERIADVINNAAARGVTGLYGKGMYTNEDKTVLLCVASRNEVFTIRTIVENIDSNAFIIIANAREVFGKGFKEEKLKVK